VSTARARRRRLQCSACQTTTAPRASEARANPASQKCAPEGDPWAAQCVSQAQLRTEDADAKRTTFRRLGGDGWCGFSMTGTVVAVAAARRGERGGAVKVFGSHSQAGPICRLAMLVDRQRDIFTLRRIFSATRRARARGPRRCAGQWTLRWRTCALRRESRSKRSVRSSMMAPARSQAELDTTGCTVR
jgi:hypothetical protein